MRPKLQKQSALKLAGRIIPRSGGFNTRDFKELCYNKINAKEIKINIVIVETPIPKAQRNGIGKL
jgi:hypothetical protein